MKGLTLLGRTNDRRTFNIAAWHSPHSMTWSWIVSLSLPRGDEGRWLHFSAYRTNVGLQWILQVARVGLRFHRQRPMWYRDLYERKRDQLDGIEQAVQHAGQHPPRSPFTPTVIEGGQSLH